ncbi:hypothetical protein EYF80_022987 [Liparis tanakae]|uniref:Uncharacterized protein n=1 Tax=Liparis tanakae TaxID=230148 RepID=A0A4Z2HN67_9TELE|nr:hypothetical protein EYF80_022987 [Liparis tanakae]
MREEEDECPAATQAPRSFPSARPAMPLGSRGREGARNRPQLRLSQRWFKGKAAVQTQHLPGPFSRKMTLDSGKKLEPTAGQAGFVNLGQLLSRALGWEGRSKGSGGKREEDHLLSCHSTGIEAACSDSTFPLGCGMWTLNTTRTRVFLRPMSVSPFRSSMSEFRSLRMPAQSILREQRGGIERNFENFGAGEHDLLAGRGHGFPGDAVHLVEGVRPQVTVVRRPDEHLQVDGLLTVTDELRSGQSEMEREK